MNLRTIYMTLGFISIGFFGVLIGWILSDIFSGLFSSNVDLTLFLWKVFLLVPAFVGFIGFMELYYKAKIKSLNNSELEG